MSWAGRTHPPAGAEPTAPTLGFTEVTATPGDSTSWNQPICHSSQLFPAPRKRCQGSPAALRCIPARQEEGSEGVAAPESPESGAEAAPAPWERREQPAAPSLLGAQRGRALFRPPRSTMMWLFLTIPCFMLIAAKSAENPEVSMDVGEIVRYHGYPYEEHEVLTEDGYFLTLQRIPHGRGNPGSFSLPHKAGAQPSNMFCPPPKAVVLLQHGLVLEGSNWVTNLPNTSLGFILADAGYDVWIGNSRGNSWSRKHQEFEFHQQEYSAYSFHEMAMYDLPASINYILQRTGQEQLYYVAYSQGTTTGFIAFSSIPELDRKIKMFFALAPITVNSNMKSPLVRVFDLPEALIKIILGQTVVFDKGEVLKQVISTMCTYPMLKTVCSLVFYLPGGFTNSLNVSRMDVYLARYPDSTSLKNMLHWRQLYQTGEFKHYDYGSDNVLHYNQTTPPFYELENMKTPLAAWYGGKDWISAPEDVNITLPRISNVAYKKYIPEFVHFDFLWGKQVYEQVYKEMLDLMEKGA